MNCQNFAEILTELARDPACDQPADPMHAAAVVHLKDCPECALRLQDGRALTHDLSEMATAMKSLTASARLEDEVRKAFRLTLQQPVLSPSRRGERYPRWRRWTVAAAAVVLIVLGAGVARLLPGWLRAEFAPSKTAKTERVPVQLPPLVATGVSSVPSNSNQKLILPGRRTNRQRRATHSFKRPRNTPPPVTQEATTVLADDIESEVTTQFIALSYGGPINPQDGGQLVRVELSRLAMLSMGLPVNMDRYSESVKADVLLGPDGLARAIRFVQ